MRRALLLSLVACLVTVHQARLIEHCDLAKLLHQEDMDGFEGHSLSDWLCLGISVKATSTYREGNENADGSFDYGIFQINSHYWCTEHWSSTRKNILPPEVSRLLRTLSSLKLSY